MEISEPSNLSQINLKFQQGQRFFEAGRYKEAIQCLNQACALVEPQSKASGEMRIWLVTAYDASGNRKEALSLCRQLTRSPYIDVRKQAKRLLSILEAPKLSIHDDWVTQIPPLESVNSPGEIRGVARPTPPPKTTKPKPAISDQEVDLSQVTTSDKGLAWVASLFVGLLGLGLVWMAKG